MFNAKKQYVVTQHRLSEIDTNLYTVLVMISTQILLKSVRYNKHLQVYLNISEIIIARKKSINNQFAILAKREKIFSKKCTKYLHKFERELTNIMLLGNEKCQNKYFLCQN